MMKFKVVLITIFSLTIMSYLSAQSGVNSSGNAYIHSNSEIGLHSNLIFNNNGAGTNPGIIITNRDSQNPGAIAFGEKGSWENANDSQHIDGYARVYNNSAFTFPIGNLGFYKPVSISGGFGTMASYTFDNPLKLPFIGNAVTSRAAGSSQSATSVNVSEVEYWDIRGDKATEITLYWDTNSEIGQLTNDDLSTLTIVGWNGSSWEIISSSVDENVLNISQAISSRSNSKSDKYNGSITSKAIVPNDYEVFTFAVIGNENSGDIEFGSEFSNNERIELTLFPNPTYDISEVNIDYKVSDVTSDVYLEVFNELGESLYRKQLLDANGIIQLPFNQSTSGMYHIGISTKNGSKLFKPVVVTN